MFENIRNRAAKALIDFSTKVANTGGMPYAPIPVTYDSIAKDVCEGDAIRAKVAEFLKPRDTTQFGFKTKASFVPLYTTRLDDVVKHLDEIKAAIPSKKKKVQRACETLKLIASKHQTSKKIVLDQHLPQLSISETCWSIFKIKGINFHEVVTMVYDNLKDGSEVVRVISVPNAPDLNLVGFFSGTDNMFPNAPSPRRGVNCSLFSNPGAGFQWGSVNAGIPVTAYLEIDPSIFSHIETIKDCDTVPKKIEVVAHVAISGPYLRG